MLGYDIETTGIDFWHGCAPFAAAAVSDTGVINYWEWDVDPETRLPLIKPVEIELLGDTLSEDSMVCHNVSFDMHGTEMLFRQPELKMNYQWDWDGIEDTLIASHTLRNLWPHDLKTLRSTLLLFGNNTVDYVNKAVNKARSICGRKDFIRKKGHWRIANPLDPHWPAIKDAPKSRRGKSGWWLCDMWLPKAIWRLAPEFLPSAEDYPVAYGSDTRHPWSYLVEKYCIEDAMSTVVLWDVLKDALKEEDLWDQYQERKRLLVAGYQMESQGVSIIDRISKERQHYHKEAERHRKICETILKKKGIVNPNTNSAKQLQAILYGEFGLKVTKRTQGGAPSTDAETLEKLSDESGSGTEVASFIDHLILSRRNSKAEDYSISYEKWSTPTNGISDQFAKWQATGKRSRTSDSTTGNKHPDAASSIGNHSALPRGIRGYIHCSCNITGTKFTRQSTSNPNLQNVGTGKEGPEGEVDYRLRLNFGPAPGKIWSSWDYSNIELRIWAYLCGNREFVQAFEKGESIHLLICRELHPELSKLSDDEVKGMKAYKHTKNGNFAIIYGSSPFKADLTYKVRGAYGKLSRRFPEVRLFTESLHREVMTKGFIETLTGYRLWIPIEDPHKAVSGKVQGTAGAVIGRAMVACTDFLSREYPEGKLILQVHDELVFELPESVPKWVFKGIAEKMKTIGDSIRIPLEVGGEIFRENWAEGERIKI